MIDLIPPFSITPEECKQSSHQVLFQIPIYQRLYTWEEVEIIALIEDLKIAFEKNEGHYFLGNIVISKNQWDERYVLIDGQQRLTTLWLLGSYLRTIDKSWDSFLWANSNQLRIEAFARDRDKKYLTHLVSGDEKSSIEPNPVMANAIRIFERLLPLKGSTQNGDSLFPINEWHKIEDLSSFILKKTLLNCIVLHPNADLNKFFEAMNNRGKQLEQHEILKARVLSKISDSDKDREMHKYAQIWDACAQLDNYVEYWFDDNRRQDFRQSALALLESLSDEKNALLKNISDLFSDDDTQNTNSITLDLLLRNYEPKLLTDKKERNINRYNSILRFPELLIIAYYTWKSNERSLSWDASDLLKIFEEEDFDSSSAKSFIHHLLYIRILFDQHIVKYDPNSNNYILSRIEKDNSSEKYKRSSETEHETILIQTMFNSLFPTFRQAHKWILHILKSALIKTNTYDTAIAVEEYLEELKKGRSLDDSLNNGTSTAKFWFFYLDYLLWKENQAFFGALQEPFKFIKSLIANFQFRQNRSVEHIEPQNLSYGQLNNINNIDCFGNLALISSSSNSSYSNMSFLDKRERFIKYCRNYNSIESLKQFLIFTNEKWTEETCSLHQTAVINLIKKNLQQSPSTQTTPAQTL